MLCCTSSASTPMSWEQSLAANYTDAILVLHRGRVVYERNCVGCHGPEGRGDGPASALLDPLPIRSPWPIGPSG